MVARISDAAFPVELADAALPDAELLGDDPVSSAPLEVAEEDPSGSVSSGMLFLSIGLTGGGSDVRSISSRRGRVSSGCCAAGRGAKVVRADTARLAGSVGRGLLLSAISLGALARTLSRGIYLSLVWARHVDAGSRAADVGWIACPVLADVIASYCMQPYMQRDMFAVELGTQMWQLAQRKSSLGQRRWRQGPKQRL